MAWYPRAADHNIPPGPSDPPIVPRIVVLHTMVGTIESAQSRFTDGEGVEAHFGVAMDGRVWQWRDTAIQADAQAAGNDYCISIETEDKGDPSRPWTPQQLLALDVLITWLGKVHSIPMRLVAATTERGIGYHRQFPEWNPHIHSCPGDVRLGQLVHDLIPALNQEGILQQLTTDDLNAIKGAVKQAVFVERSAAGTLTLSEGLRIIQGLAGLSHTTVDTVTAIQTMLGTLAQTVGDDEQTILGALAALHLNLSDDDIGRIATEVDIDYQRVADAVRLDLAGALAQPPAQP
jgi:hypothetical protein